MEATEELQRLEQKVAFAKGREDQVLADRSRASRAVSAAESLVALYNESLGAEDVDEDPAEEQRLLEELRHARERSEPAAWAARLEGAERARVAAEQERDAFGREHFGEIAGEQAPLDGPVAERLADAWAELQAAERAYAERVRAWTRIVPFGDLTAADVPPVPTSGGDQNVVRSRFAGGIEPPTPRPLRRAVEEQTA